MASLAILSTGFFVGRHEAGREGRSRSSSRPPLPRVRREQRQATAAATRRDSWARAVRAPRRHVRERLGVEHAARQERRAEHTTARGRRAATAALSDKTADMRLLDPAEQKTKGAKSDTPSLVSQGRWTGSGGCARGSSRSCSPSSSTRHAVDRDGYLDTQMLLMRSSCVGVRARARARRVVHGVADHRRVATVIAVVRPVIFAAIGDDRHDQPVGAAVEIDDCDRDGNTRQSSASRARSDGRDLRTSSIGPWKYDTHSQTTAVPNHPTLFVDISR